MQLKVRRSQRETGVLSKTAVFCLDARVSFTESESRSISRYKLGKEIIYSSQANQKYGQKMEEVSDGSTRGGLKALAYAAMTRLTLTVNRIELQEADLLAFEALDRHGYLSWPFLYRYQDHLRKDRTRLQNRLTEFYHGSLKQGYFLERPAQQYAQFNAHARHVVYGLAPNAKQLLAERGTLTTHSPRKNDPFIHQLMASCVGASFELHGKEHGLAYISRNEILTHPKQGEAKDSKTPLVYAQALRLWRKPGAWFGSYRRWLQSHRQSHCASPL